MPKTNGERDRLGIRHEGAILNGEISVQDGFRMEAGRLLQQRPRTGAPADPHLDPVLRYHLRLDSRR